MVNELKMMDLNMTEKDIQSQCIRNELVKPFPFLLQLFFAMQYIWTVSKDMES